MIMPIMMIIPTGGSDSYFRKCSKSSGEASVLGRFPFLRKS